MTAASALDLFDRLRPEQQSLTRWVWEAWARPEQMPPRTPWKNWLICAGRGWGKTRSGAEWVREKIESGACKKMAVIAADAKDARDVLVEGVSGIQSVCHPIARPTYNPSLKRLTWPSGAVAHLYSADDPDELRGPQFDGAWVDELAKYRYDRALWDQLQLSLRLGTNPQVVITTTPRPTPLIKSLVADPKTVVTGGSTFQNRANLAAAYLESIDAQYSGTRIGRQEIEGLVLDDADGAFWNRAQLEALTAAPPKQFSRIVVAIDPPASHGENSDLAGIVVAGAVGFGKSARYHVLSDLSRRASPDQWARVAADAYNHWRADLIVAEANQGGEMVRSVLRSHNHTLPVKLVHASRGKSTRAEPVAALYEQARVFHAPGLGPLEDQMCSWVPGETAKSPDRVDALVWALTELALDSQSGLVQVKFS